MRGRLHKSAGSRSTGGRVAIRLFRIFERYDLTVAGSAALKLVANLLGRGRLGRATVQEKRDRDGQQGFHLEML